MPPVSVERWLLRESGTAESFGARRQSDFLERVAASTGGSYRLLEDIGALPEALAADNAALTRAELLPLWNMPLFLPAAAAGQGRGMAASAEMGSDCDDACRLFATIVLAGVGGTAVPVAAEVAGVVVAGLGGTPEYADSFADSAALVAGALESLAPGRAAGEPDGGAAGDGSGPATADRPIERLGAEAGREAILAAIERQGARDADTFALVLIGHGSNDGSRLEVQRRRSRSGAGTDLVAALATVRAPRQLVVLGASASGALLETLAQPGRVVVTATKSGGELNAVRFPAFFAEALDSAVADLDRNEILTVAEAFRHARRAHPRVLRGAEPARLRARAARRARRPRSFADRPARGAASGRRRPRRCAALLDTRLSLERDYRALLGREGRGWHPTTTTPSWRR